MPSSHLEPRWSLTGQQYSHSRQPSPCLNAHNTPSRTPLLVRSNQKRSEQLDPGRFTRARRSHGSPVSSHPTENRCPDLQPHPLVRKAAQTPGNLQNHLHPQEISGFSAWRIQAYLYLLCLR